MVCSVLILLLKALGGSSISSSGTGKARDVTTIWGHAESVRDQVSLSSCPLITVEL